MVEAVKGGQTFFLNSIGPTLEVLAFFSSSKAATLLALLSKKSQSVFEKKKQDIMQMCAPSIFDAQMQQLEPIKHVSQTIPVQKVIHLRASIFLVSYINGLIEMLDFDNAETEPLARFQVPNGDVQEDDPACAFEPLFPGDAALSKFSK